METPKRYDPQIVEEKWQLFWQKEGVYSFNETDDKKKVYSIDTPPPYASADHLHVGHAMHYSQFEFIARFKRMQGYNVFFPMGYDDNGLPTERFVEKKHKVNKNKITRANFIKLCLEETKLCGKTYHNLFNALGFSVDWTLLYQTIDSNSRRVAQASFIDLHKKGHLLREDLPATWCMSCQTTIAQADFENVDIESQFNDIAFECAGKEIIISTTRPELLGACVALFANPDDDRYKELKGKFAKVPLFDYDVPILFDESVDKEKGTGLMMVCTFGDKEDIEKWHKYNLPLRIIFTEYGKLNEHAGKYAGLKIKEARSKIIEDLKEKNMLKVQRKTVHAVNVHERCGTEIEFLKKPQWSIRVLDKKEELIEIADKINWYPQHMKIRYQHWVKNLQWNWGISRQRYYGVPFPLWYCKKCSAIYLPDIDELPVDPREEQPKNSCSCGSTEFEPEMDVMDTWMTSSVSPRINAHWTLPTERKDFVPMSLRPQAHDIIRTWAFYTIVKEYFHAKNIPWKDIMISGHGQDPKGQKMSKSRGNVVRPQEVIKQYSADALRFWAAGVKLGDDLPYMEKDIVSGQKMITKLWNASRFVLGHLETYSGQKPETLEALDSAVLCKLNEVIAVSTEYFDRYEYSKCKLEVEKFFWQTFCDNYLEVCKDRIYNPEERGEGAKLSAQYTLSTVLKVVLKLLAPIMPHITEEIYQLRFAKEEGKKSIHISTWPEQIIVEEAQNSWELVVQVISAARKYKAEKQLSLKVPINKILVHSPNDLIGAEEDIKAVTKAKNLEIKRSDEFSVEIQG